MALGIINYSTNYGITLGNIYAKITSVSYNTNNGECFIHLEYFNTKDDADDKKMSVGQYTNSFVIENPNGNIREQCYTYLKTLPEFSDATDILE